MKKHDKGRWTFVRSAPLSPRFFLPMLGLLAAGVFLVLLQWAILSSDDDSFTLGSPSPQTYPVIVPMRYADQQAAATLRKMVSESVVSVTVRDPSSKARLRRRLEALHTMDAASREILLPYVPETLLDALSKMDEAARSKLLNLAVQIGDAYISRREAAGVFMDSDAETSILWEEISRAGLSVEDANLVYQILIKLGDLNFKVDQKLTEKVRQEIADSIPTIERRLDVGDIIISRGETVSQQAARLLRLQGYTEDVFPAMRLGIVLVLTCFLPLWLNILGWEATEHYPSWGCMAFLILIAWILGTLATRLHIPGGGMVPAVLAACLCTQGTFAFNAALTGTITSTLIAIDITVFDLLMILSMAVISSAAGFYLLRSPESRGQINRRVFMLTVFLTFARLSLRCLQELPLASGFFRVFSPDWGFWMEYGAYFLFEITAAHIVVMLLPMIEESLGVLSILRLRELSHPSSLLLRTLQKEASGTYQHCLTIATLIEAVAVDLGMDVNLVKAGAYYHDIGKLRRPQFYVENQQGGPNIHDSMSPSLSALTIISHVNEGLQMAWDAKLPRRIRDFIAEHHGTTCVRYFYNKAKAAGEKVEWEDFCYPGPKPQSRETALLMIVDSTEAAVRSMNLGRKLAVSEDDSEEESGGHPNRGRSQNILAMQQVIEQVVNSKAGEGQFSDVNFTQKDLTQVKESLLNALLSLYHTRKVKKIENKS